MDDLISKSALVDVFEERMQDDNVMCPVIKVLDVLEIVEDAPTVDAVEVVHGEWESYPSNLYKRCSVCKREYDKLRNNFVGNYCPSCGAKMDGGDEG